MRIHRQWRKVEAGFLLKLAVSAMEVGGALTRVGVHADAGVLAVWLAFRYTNIIVSKSAVCHRFSLSALLHEHDVK